MSDIIKIIIKQEEQSSGPDQFNLDEIQGGGETLFEDDESITVSLGEGQYDFQIEVYLDNSSGTSLKHTIYLTQGESDETLRPGDNLPGSEGLPLPKENGSTTISNNGSNHTTQNESDETLKPGKLPGSNDLFG